MMNQMNTIPLITDGLVVVGTDPPLLTALTNPEIWFLAMAVLSGFGVDGIISQVGIELHLPLRQNISPFPRITNPLLHSYRALRWDTYLAVPFLKPSGIPQWSPAKYSH